MGRILKSDIFTGGRFAAPEKSGQLLEHIVTGTLDHKPLKENAILMDFYGYAANDLVGRADARIGAFRLRKKLTEYYATVGADDDIVIGVPKGQYKAVFSENPLSAARKEMRLGYIHVEGETLQHIGGALNHFEKAVELRPDLADGWAGIANAYLTHALNSFTDGYVHVFERAQDAAQKAKTLDENCWRADVGLGNLSLYRHNWFQADAAYAEAQRIAPQEMSESASYGMYLLSRGRLEDARVLARYDRDRGFDNPVVLSRAAFIFYMLRDYDAARELLYRATILNQNFWRSHLLSALVYLGLEMPHKAVEEMEEVGRCVGTAEWLGLEIVCLEEAGKSDKAEAKFKALQQLHGIQYQSSTQLALAYLGLGDVEQAITYLGVACDVADPFTAWLHLWPLLDPLRKHRRFRELIRKWGFPSAYSGTRSLDPA